MWFGHFHICKRTHQLVISLWMIYIFKILLWTPKEVTKMIVKNDNSNLPYLLPSWQNILFIYLYFFRFSFVFRRKKASDFSFFEKTELSRNFHALVVSALGKYNSTHCSIVPDITPPSNHSPLQHQPQSNSTMKYHFCILSRLFIFVGNSVFSKNEKSEAFFCRKTNEKRKKVYSTKYY